MCQCFLIKGNIFRNYFKIMNIFMKYEENIYRKPSLKFHERFVSISPFDIFLFWKNKKFLKFESVKNINSEIKNIIFSLLFERRVFENNH